jgi:HAD superfamily phosphoserine phosphatase-like hydrolase
MNANIEKHYLVASDFDQTLSFNDSGFVLAEILGISDYGEKVEGLAKSNLVQQGGELAYLIRHDPAFRGVRREHLTEAGRRVRMKSAIPSLVKFLDSESREHRFSFFVISAAPREVVVAALDGVVAAERIYATELDYQRDTGEVCAIHQVAAGFGKVAVIDALAARLEIARERIIYVGDGSSDVHVMLHVNNGDGFTIAVSENKQLARIAKSTVLSDNALSIVIPILDQVLGWQSTRIRSEIESKGLVLQDWHKARTDHVTIVNPADVRVAAG